MNVLLWDAYGKGKQLGGEGGARMVWIEFPRGNKGDIVKNFSDIEFFFTVFIFLFFIFMNCVGFFKLSHAFKT